MAFFTWSQSIAAGASFQPLDQQSATWKYQYAPYNAIAELLHRATAIGVVVQITAGSDEIQQESPVSAGGTAGVQTGRLNVEPVTFKVAAGDLMQIRYRNTSGGAVTVDGTIELTKMAG